MSAKNGHNAVAGRIMKTVDKLSSVASSGFHVAQKGMPAVYPHDYSNRTVPHVVDQLQAVKYLKAMAGGGNDAPTSTIAVTMTPADIAEINDKAATVQQTKFDEWFGEVFYSSLPAERELMKKTYPEFFDNMVKFNEETHELQKDVARIGIKGAESFDDLVKIYVLQQDRDLRHRVFSGTSPAAPEANITDLPQYKRGLMNYFKFNRNADLTTTAITPMKLQGGDFGTGIGSGEFAVRDRTNDALPGMFGLGLVRGRGEKASDGTISETARENDRYEGTYADKELLKALYGIVRQSDETARFW